MPDHRPEPQSISTHMDPAVMLEVRHVAHRAGVAVAEVMRNFLVTQGSDLASMTVDGITAVTPDFDAELVGLLLYEETMDEQCGERGDDQ